MYKQHFVCWSECTTIIPGSFFGGTWVYICPCVLEAVMALLSLGLEGPLGHFYPQVMGGLRHFYPWVSMGRGGTSFYPRVMGGRGVGALLSTDLGRGAVEGTFKVNTWNGHTFWTFHPTSSCVVSVDSKLGLASATTHAVLICGRRWVFWRYLPKPHKMMSFLR